MQPFHLAFPVRDVSEAKDFYGSKLGLQEGRSAKSWVDYSLFGHQIVCHHIQGYNAANTANAGTNTCPALWHSCAPEHSSQAIETCRRQSGLNMVSTLLVFAVDGDPVPVPHFGMALEVQQFHDLAARVREAGIHFILDPHVRFEGTAALHPESQKPPDKG